MKSQKRSRLSRATSHATFPFLSLPAEIRLQIYRLALPNGLRVAFCKDDIPSWRESGDFDVFDLASAAFPDDRKVPDDVGIVKPRISTGLFLVNRVISKEARSVFYGENEFVFGINGGDLKRYDSTNERIFGPLGTPDGLSTLRRMRRVELNVRLSRAAYRSHRCHRMRLQHFVEAFAEVDDGGRPLLKSLKVEFDPSAARTDGCRFLGYPPARGLRWQYPLEELTLLRDLGIEQVEFRGVMDDWFAKCLEKAIAGTGGKLHEIQYPEVERKRRKYGGKKRRKTYETSRSWHMPKYDWQEFAEKNGIQRPGE